MQIPDLFSRWIFLKYNKLKEYNELRSELKEHKKRYIKKLKFGLDRPERLLGQNGLNLLQHSLYRSSSLIRGSIEEFTLKNR